MFWVLCQDLGSDFYFRSSCDGRSCVWVCVSSTFAPAAVYFSTKRLDWSLTGLTCLPGAAGSFFGFSSGKANNGGGGVCNQEAEGKEAEDSTATGGDLMNEACSSARVPLSLLLSGLCLSVTIIPISSISAGQQAIHQ